MRIEIKTDGYQFRVDGMPKPKADYRDKARQATTQDGRPIWTVRLAAIDTAREATETIWVEVAGDEPKLTFNGFALVHGLVYAPWVGKDGKIRRAFRADAIEAAPGSKQSVHAA